MKCSACGSETRINWSGSEDVLCQDCSGSSPNLSSGSQRSARLDNTPVLPSVLFGLAGLSFLGGVTLSVIFWPEAPVYGQDVKLHFHMLSIIWFSVGVVEAALFSAIGSALSYLHIIASNTSAQQNAVVGN